MIKLFSLMKKVAAKLRLPFQGETHTAFAATDINVMLNELRALFISGLLGSDPSSYES